jgi:hypothetical protein
MRRPPETAATGRGWARDDEVADRDGWFAHHFVSTLLALGLDGSVAHADMEIDKP